MFEDARGVCKHMGVRHPQVHGTTDPMRHDAIEIIELKIVVSHFLVSEHKKRTLWFHTSLFRTKQNGLCFEHHAC